MKDIFELNGTSAPSIVPTNECDCSDDFLVPCEAATEVYWNGFDQVVIRQQSPFDEDTWVVFNRSDIPVLIARLQQMLKEDPE